MPGACAGHPAPLARASTLVPASCLQPLLPPGGTGQGKDCSKVTGTWPGKAQWQLLGLAGLSALRCGLFWELSSQNTPPSSLVPGPVAADSKYSLKETISPKTNVTSSKRPSLTFPRLNALLTQGLA